MSKKIVRTKNKVLLKNEGEVKIILPDGTLAFCEKKAHREGAPAVINNDGTEEYWQKGKLHRENGPAIITLSGQFEYYVYNNLHRENGAAISHEDGGKEYWVNGKLIDADIIELKSGDFLFAKYLESVMYDIRKLPDL